MGAGILFLFLLLIIIYFTVLGGILYLSYRYIKYINDLEKKKCECSRDIKRNMIKNFSYLILISWLLFVMAVMITPTKTMMQLVTGKIFNIIKILIIGAYGAILFLYSKKLIDESCSCSESWVREAMQYQSYIYIFFSGLSFLILVAKLLIGDNYKDLIKIQKVLSNRK